MTSARTVGIRNLRWVILGLLFLGTVLNYMDMQTLSVLAPELMKQLKMGQDAYARILETFLVAYLISFAFGGWVLDKLGVRRGMALALVWWSVAAIAHGFAQNALHLMICRGLFGFAYPGAYLAAAKVVSEWYPAKERAIGTGAYTAGATVGATLAPPLIAWLALAFGWRYAFVLTGSLGFIYLALWLLVYRPPEEHKWLTEDEKRYILAGRESAAPIATEEVSYPVKDVLRRRQFWAVAVGRMIGDNPWIFLVAFVPTFLSSAHGWDLIQIGHFLWIPFVFADVGSLGGGFISGQLIKRGMPVLKARLLLMGCAALVLSFQFFLGYLSSTAGIIVALSIMMLGATTWLVNIGTIPVDLFPKSVLGRVVGLTTSGSILGSLLFVPFVGRMLEAKNYTLLFGVMSVLPPIAFIVSRLLIGRLDGKAHGETPAVAKVDV